MACQIHHMLIGIDYWVDRALGLGLSFYKRLCNHDEMLALPVSSKETNHTAHKDQLELFVMQQTLKNNTSQDLYH